MKEKNLGWLPLYRQIQQHWLWQDKPFSRGQAWIDILLMANHNHETKQLINGTLYTLSVGDIIISERFLSERWGWSKTKIRHFLEILEQDNMIKCKKDHQKTAIKVLNYEKFQDSRTKKEPPKDHIETTEGPPKDQNTIINNNYNNYNKYSDRLQTAIKDFIDYRANGGKPLTDKGINALCKRLEKLCDNDNGRCDIIYHAISSGWNNVYPLRENEAKPKNDYAGYDLSKYDEMLNSKLL